MGSIENYTKLCTIEIDLSHLPLSSRPKYFGRGNFYRLEYDIILLFGLTELKAMVSWKQDVGLLLFLLHSLFTYGVSSGCGATERSENHIWSRYYKRWPLLACNISMKLSIAHGSILTFLSYVHLQFDSSNSLTWESVYRASQVYMNVRSTETFDQPQLAETPWLFP